MFSTAEIKEHLTKAFSSLQENVPKGKLTHSAEIQAFQKYFETVYNPTNIIDTVCYATPILKEKFEKQIAKRKSLKTDKATTPLISTANQSDPSSGMNPSPHPTVSGAIQNKGSSTGAHNIEEDNTQNEEETSSPGEDGKRDSKHVGEKDSTGKENSENTPSDSPARVAFPSNDADEDDQDSDEIEGYFREDEDINMGEADTEGNQTGTSNASVDTVPNLTKVRPSCICFI
ncbi:uncharacterized protein LOC127081582 [Lathyrus oleraceus]|uniref:uncharacterized protein LOC127081582 n=1 Tax=Pisum sativum TaxID=3888 RepID=UPI0021CDF2CD|nr:uncharacterized protein LOC127081582 [Pisum sativum]